MFSIDCGGGRVKSDHGKKARAVVGVCLKDCQNKDTEVCQGCIRFSNYKKKEKNNEENNNNYSCNDGVSVRV